MNWTECSKSQPGSADCYLVVASAFEKHDTRPQNSRITMAVWDPNAETWYENPGMDDFEQGWRVTHWCPLEWPEGVLQEQSGKPSRAELPPADEEVELSRGEKAICTVIDELHLTVIQGLLAAGSNLGGSLREELRQREKLLENRLQ